MEQKKKSQLDKIAHYPTNSCNLLPLSSRKDGEPPLIVIPAQAGIHKVELRIEMIESRKEKLLILIS